MIPVARRETPRLRQGPERPYTLGMGIANPSLYQPRIAVVTGEAQIPPFGVVALVSESEGVWTVGKTATNNNPHVYILGDKTLTNASGDKADATFWPWGRVAYEPADGVPAINEEWGPKAGSFYLHKDQQGFRITGGADGFTVAAVRIPNDTGEDDYPYGSYGGGAGGSSYAHQAILNIGCDEATGNIVADLVEYTVIGFNRAGRLYLSISMEVIDEDFTAVPTVCVEVVTGVSVSIAISETDCVISATPTVTETLTEIRTIDCGSCG